jgi:hypothetical protein
VMKRLFILLTVLGLTANSWATDYTFGGDTTGTTATQLADSTMWLDTVTSGANTGNLDSVIAWIVPYTNVARNWQFVIYNADSTILDSTAEIATGTEGTITRYRADFVNGAAITAETKYFIGSFWTDGEAGVNARVVRNATVTTWMYSAVSADLLTTFTKDGGGATAVGRINMLLYYSDGGAPAAATKKIGAVKLGAGKI